MNRSKFSYGTKRKSNLMRSLNRSNRRQHSRRGQNWLIKIGECLGGGKPHQYQHHQSMSRGRSLRGG